MLYISRNLRVFALLVGAACLAPGCNQVTVDDIPDGCAPLHIAVGVDSRAIVDGTSLSSGDAIGVTVVDATGTLYDSQAYNNVAFTASGAGTSQAWTGEKDILLSGTEGTLYAYYPYTPGIDPSAIPVDMTAADQIDWMYAREADSDAGYGVSNTDATVRLTLNHALVNVRLNFLKGDYIAAGALQSVSVSSPAFATGGVLDARTGTWTSTNEEQTQGKIAWGAETLTGERRDIPNPSQAKGADNNDLLIQHLKSTYLRQLYGFFPSNPSPAAHGSRGVRFR